MVVSTIYTIHDRTIDNTTHSFQAEPIAPKFEIWWIKLIKVHEDTSYNDLEMVISFDLKDLTQFKNNQIEPDIIFYRSHPTGVSRTTPSMRITALYEWRIMHRRMESIFVWLFLH